MIKIMKINFFLILLFYFSNISQLISAENKIILKVNNEIITSVDLLNEIEYLKILNNNLNNLSIEKLIEIAKNSLIREKIRKVEAYNYFQDPKIEEKYFKPYINEIMKKSNVKSEKQLIDSLNSKGIDMQTINKKIETEILWNQLILNKFSSSVKIDRNKIKNDILKNNKQKEYLLSEIIFNIENENIDKKFNKIKNEIIKSGFESAATIFSISDSAKVGGKIGWVNYNSLSKVIKEEIIKIKKNEYTNPIVIPGGFLILKIEEEKTVNVIKDIKSEVENVSRTIMNKQLNQYSNVYFNKIKKEFQIDEL